MRIKVKQVFVYLLYLNDVKYLTFPVILVILFYFCIHLLLLYTVYLSLLISEQVKV